MAENKQEKEQPTKLKPSTGVSRPTISLPPRPFGEMFFSGGVGFSPGPMTLVSNLFSDPDEFKSFSHLLAGAMASPAAAAVAVVATAHHQTPVSSVGDGGGSGGDVVDPRFKQNRPTGLMITQPPGMFTVPPGLSPATLLDSPSFFGLFSPLQGAFGMTHQQALAQVTAQAVQGNNVHFQQSESEYPSSIQQEQQQQPQTSLTENQSFSTGHRSQVPAPVQDSSQGQRETSDISVSEHRSQPQNADKPADDGYNWRKYGQKQVKGSDFPRSYYKCTHTACPVKKKVERSLDGQVTEIIYKGQHNHELPQKRGNNNGSSKNSDTATQFQTSNSNLSKTKRDQETSQVTTTEQMSEASDSEEVGNAETSVGEKHEDEPDAKRRNTEVRVTEPVVASSHKTVTEPRIIVQTRSEVDLLDDGYRWRKYGQKVVKGNPYPRSYYKCTTPACGVRKHVERAANDPKAVVTTYEGKHNHDVPAARTSSHQLRPNNQHNTSTGNFNQQQPVARLRLKEEQIS
ncbi:hypothetical protein CARUB_v10017039mg [Capsella rubella]|uniref:WRKY domain-containing protein n=1 Tax=Capsella rubella TaxID=81985 RepID=R0H3G8_9BRAS|nr:probable WRKY transcription factor 3 [Capsella rubella]EOA23824.1 hypothetical protein CARUB_v10017039mg [Capsella rubella]